MRAAPPSDNVSQPFRLEASGLRGRLVRVGAAVDALLGRHAYPEPVSTLLGELVVLAASLSGALKFEGVFSLQTRSDGPISLMVADCTNDGALRAYASFDAERLPDPDSADLQSCLGQGLLALTVDQSPSAETYQGIVELEGDSLADCMRAYFRRSEQIATGLRLAVGREAGRWRAGAIVVQRIPGEGGTGGAGGDGGESEEDWRRAMILLDTVRDYELADPGLPVHDVLFRLFHEEGVRVFEPHGLHFGCRCSEARVRNMLRQFTREELLEMRRDDGLISVVCQFCSAEYLLDDDALRELLGGLH
jgi:molecular chaperone Hsp33